MWENEAKSLLGNLEQRFSGPLPETETHLVAEMHRWEAGDAQGPPRERRRRAGAPFPPRREVFSYLLARRGLPSRTNSRT